MAYVVFQGCGGRGGIPRGMLSMSPRGMGRFNASDLAAVGIKDRATLLIDRERHSLAIRSPVEGEQGQFVGSGHRDSSKTVWLRGALLAIGLNPADLHGWIECVADDMPCLVVRVDQTPQKRLTSKPRRSER